VCNPKFRLHVRNIIFWAIFFFFTSSMAPRGEIFLPGGCSPLRSPPGVNTLYCLEEWRSKQRISPLGIFSPPKGQIHPLGTTSPLVDNFAPGGQLRPWGQSLPLGAKL
jgi:hypothetical protein